MMEGPGSVKEFKEKFIAFIDILGFKSLVRSAEAGVGFSLAELLDAGRVLGTQDDRKHAEHHGPTLCPCAPRVRDDIDFQITQISDCVIVSTEISPAGVINLLHHCWTACMTLLLKGIMCRGYIKRGLIYHSEAQFLGSGYIDAYGREQHVSIFKRDADERGTPFVEIDPEVVSFINDQPDPCVAKMFDRMVITDDQLVALFPFRRLSHSFLIEHDFDPAREKSANDRLRQGIQRIKGRVRRLVDQDDPSAVGKSDHYIRALDEQLRICDQTDESIDALCRPLHVVHRATRNVYVERKTGSGGRI